MIETKINELIENRDKIPEEFWRPLEHNQNRTVIWVINRQKPSICADYSFDEERLGITDLGHVVWGFDSGCSCPSPWADNENCYTIDHTWKEFLLSYNEKDNPENHNWYCKFDPDWETEASDNMKDYLILINPVASDILLVRNMEIQRYLIARFDIDVIKKEFDAKTIDWDGTNELLLFNMEIQNLVYINVKDGSSDRRYLLSVPNTMKRVREAIAWTFNLKEEEYNPIIET